MYFDIILGLSILFLGFIRCGKTTNRFMLEADTLYDKLRSVPKYKNIFNKMKYKPLYDPRDPSKEPNIDYSFQRLIDQIVKRKKPTIEQRAVFISLKVKTYSLVKKTKDI